MSNPTDNIDINKWKCKLQEFVENRDWRSFHNPKNLAMALSVEAAELVEIFQWLSPLEAKEIINNKEKYEHIQQEIGDILMCIIMLADELNINLATALQNKFVLTSKKYPAKTVATNKE